MFVGFNWNISSTVIYLFLGNKKRLLCIQETNHHRRIFNNVKLILSPSTRFLIYVNSLISSNILSSAHRTLTLLSRSRVSCSSLGGYCSEAPAPQFRFTYILRDFKPNLPINVNVPTEYLNCRIIFSRKMFSTPYQDTMKSCAVETASF